MMASVPHDPARAPSEIVAGDVLHHPSAGLDDLAPAIDRRHAENVIARRAGKDAPTARVIGGDHAADRGLARAVAEHGPKIDRLEGERLIALGEKLLDLADRRSGLDHEHELARLVKRNADQALGRDHGAGMHRAPELALGAAAHHLEWRARIDRLADEVGQLLDRLGSVKAEAHMPGHWTLRPSSGNTLPGLSSQSGSKACFTRICWARSASLNCKSHQLALLDADAMLAGQAAAQIDA